MINALIASLMLCTTEVFRLEHEVEAERLYIVGVDGVRRQCCLVDPEHYAMMTGQVAKIWNSLNSTPEGRSRLHGARIEADFDGTNKVVRYSDGYVHSERAKKRSASAKSSSLSRQKDVRPYVLRRPKTSSDRHWKMMQRIHDSKTNAVRNVTVIHDAATGKDVVK